MRGIPAPTLGILGGMGPVVSAELIKTIYEYNPTPTEQEAPQVVLFSLPSAPDRNQSIHTKNEGPFLAFMEAQLRRLAPLCDRILIGCCTAHYSLPSIPEELRQKVLSIMHIVDRALEKSDEPGLLIASTGAYDKRLFQDGCKNADRIIELSRPDQEIVMGLIFEVLKKGKDPQIALPTVERLLDKYGTRTFVSGCTEFHLVAKMLDAQPGNTIRAIDAFSIVAREFFDIVRPSG
ncbi:aspartate/glutamate racemase family protein [Polyangium sorediatum]|uniref:Aspartate/glutamate racemase family protein n=1 Tax=Polyangium sorediatum TaxID=889274 RepID=A0ABT6NYG1_9BACT|nr:aspartate/glutamate racemase family protein [Polyangium sorediatum]MDI1433380.1 aspartate/glutamate racemase family protein [Polyangium sorediatum]